MRFSIAAVVAALAAGVLAQGYSSSVSTPVQYTTDVVYEYVTWCPEATTLTYGGTTYTVNTPTSLTLSGSSYTVQTPIYTTTSVICNSCSGAPPVPSSATILPVVSPLYPSSPAGSPVLSSGGPAGSPSGTVPAGAAPQFTGGAPRAVVGAGAGLAGILGVAFLL